MKSIFFNRAVTRNICAFYIGEYYKRGSSRYFCLTHHVIQRKDDPNMTFRPDVVVCMNSLPQKMYCVIVWAKIGLVCTITELNLLPQPIDTLNNYKYPSPVCQMSNINWSTFLEGILPTLQSPDWKNSTNGGCNNKLKTSLYK